MAAFRAANSVREGHEWDKFEGAGLAVRRDRSVPESRAFRARRQAQAECADARHSRRPAPAQKRRPDVHPAGLRPDPGRDRAQRRSLRGPHRHHLARRDGLDQSRRLGQSPQIVRPPACQGSLPRRENSFDLCLGFRAGRPAYGTGHRRDEFVHPAVGAGPVASAVRGAAAADGHAVRSLHRARLGCAQLRLLPGFPFPSGGDAVGHHAFRRRRRPSIHRHAPDRHGAGRACRLRTGLRR